MVFSSLLFVFLFLALNLLAYSLVDPRWRNHVLLGFSLVFYAWGGPRYLLLLVGDTLVSWFFARQIEASDDARRRKGTNDRLGILRRARHAPVLAARTQGVAHLGRMRVEKSDAPL